MRKKNMLKPLVTIVLSVLFSASVAYPLYAISDNNVISDSYYCYDDENGSGHQVFLDDKANLFTPEEIESITDIMYYDALSYGNMIMLTTNDALGMSASDYQWWVYSYIYGEDSDGVAFVIDMDNRKLWMQGYGALKNQIDEDAANTITDNIYKLASDEKYGECAEEGYTQIVKTLRHENISGPLKYVGNACLAVISSILITFLLAYFLSASRKAADKEILDNITKTINITNKSVDYRYTQRIYDPPSDSGSGGSGGGGGGGGGGGHGF